MVSNGYVNPGPLEEIISFTDAFNIDLKAFTNAGYRRLTGAGLKPVRESLKMIAKSGRHLEITTLIIPGQNDSEDEIDEEARWIAGELGKDIPLHLSRYFPMYKREDPATTGAAIMHLAEIASGSLDYVYTGNIASGSFQDTRCPVCNKTVTRRTGYSLKLINLDRFGNCASCGTGIYRHFTYFPRSAQN
jgi:pyruvate formate lyase activating enzyme